MTPRLIKKYFFEDYPYVIMKYLSEVDTKKLVTWLCDNVGTEKDLWHFHTTHLNDNWHIGVIYVGFVDSEAATLFNLKF